MPSPVDSPERLAALRASGLLDGADPAPFDRLARLAVRALGAPAACVALHDAERVVPLARAGSLELTEPAGAALEALVRAVVESGGPVARVHPSRSPAQPAVFGEMAAGAGVPLHEPGGQVVGCLCVVASSPRTFGHEDLASLGDLASVGRHELALRRARLEAGAGRASMNAVVESALDAIIVMDAGGSIVEFNPAAERLFGHARDAAVGQPLHDLIIPPTHRAAHTAGVRRLADTGQARILDHRLRLPALRADGSEVLVELTVTRTDMDGEQRFIGFLRDLSAERALEVAEQRLSAVIDAAPLILIATDATGRVTLSEGSGLAGMGVKPGGLVGRSVRDVFAASPEVASDFDRALRGDSFAATREIDGLGLDTHYEPIRGPDGSVTGVVGVTLDVSERRRSEERIAHLAYHDQLTGLLNRAGLEVALSEALAREDRPRAAALLYVDLDDFKAVNDSLGHDAGDRILREAAQRLQAVTRQEDHLSRQGGDEFLLFLDELGPDAQRVAEDTARRAITAFDEPFHVNGLEFQLGATIGISVQPRDGDSFGELLRHADMAMYQAKRAGRGVHAVYTQDAADPRGRLTMPSRLRRALARDEFVLHYQPVIALGGSASSGMEALIRWEDPERGLLYPGDFIPAAEETGLICEIGAWVADAASRQMREWHQAGLASGVGFNVSPVQLRRDGFVTELAAILAANRAEPGWMIIEITEQAAMDDVVRTSRVLSAIAALGVHLAIDDFGAGHSSLTRLRHLPFSTLKIDRALMQGVDEDPASVAVVAATLALAKALKLRTVAEGVETQAQQRWLLAHGCEYAQGYALARPMPADRATAFLQGRPRVSQEPVPAPPYASLSVGS